VPDLVTMLTDVEAPRCADWPLVSARNSWTASGKAALSRNLTESRQA
jgi:hypothetical protein